MIISTVKENINWNQEKNPLSLKRKATYLATSIILYIWYLQTSLWLIPLVGFLMDMGESILLLNFMEAPFTMMLLPVLFALKISYP